MILSAQDLSFSYRNQPLFSHLSFHIPEGDFVALVGPNGSGKSTLIKLILGELSGYSGKLEIFSTSANAFSQWNLVGYVPQYYELDLNFPATVQELLSLKSCRHKKEIFSQLGITPFLSSKFISLSGGQRQRVMIALSLLSHPKLLILDEPTVGVDVQTLTSFYEFLKKLNSEGMTILLVTHDIGLVTRYAKHLLCLQGDQCMLEPMSRAGPALTALYGDAFSVVHHHDH